jgi:hypothetical protein
VTSGAIDIIFPASGAYPYQKDLKTLDLNLLDTGHFALEEEGDAIAEHITTVLRPHGAELNSAYAVAARLERVGGTFRIGCDLGTIFRKSRR